MVVIPSRYINFTAVFYYKIVASSAAFLLAFPQMFTGYSLFHHRFLEKILFLRNYHRRSGYVLLGIFLTVSILCIYVFVLSPGSTDLESPRVLTHIILGVAGYLVFPLKILNVRQGRGYQKTTPFLGIMLVIIFIGLFLTSTFSLL